MKKFMLVLTIAVAMLVLTLPAMAQVRESTVAPPPADSTKVVNPTTAARPTLSDRNPTDQYLAADGWHIRVYVNLPKAVEWSGETPVSGPFTVGIGGLLCLEQDPVVENVNGSTALDFALGVNECTAQDEGWYLWCRPSNDGITAWPWTWNHPSRAKNEQGGQIGGYRISYLPDGSFTWPGKK